MPLRMSTALTIVSMAVLMPLCVIAGIYVGHTLTIKSQQTTTNENPESRRRSSIHNAVPDGTAR
jgi:uncharacterized protein YneF (UPF0154 family)